MANVVAQSTLGKTLFSAVFTSLTADYSFGQALRIKSIIITGTASDVFCIKETVGSLATDPGNYLTLPQTTSGFFWDTGDFYVVPWIDFSECTVNDWSKVRITFHIRA